MHHGFMIHGARGACGAVVLVLAAGCSKAPPQPPRAAPAVVEFTTQAGESMVLLPGGAFRMGSSTGDPSERPVHTVRLDPFLMDRHEVTQEQFARLELPDPSRVKHPKHPVDQANWTDAARFCNERSRAEGLQPCYDEKTWSCDPSASGYRLPTEAEWEYACRAGSDTDYAYGDDPRALAAYAWYSANAAKTTHPVGRKQANAWGLSDLHGNVAEWCQDGFDPNYYQSSPEDNPRGPADAGPERVVRGGSWASTAESCRSAARAGDRSVLDTCTANDTIGFRCVRSAPVRPAP